MRKLFLTSSPGGSYLSEGRWLACELDNRNEFVVQLKKALPEQINCLMISSDPENTGMNDHMKDIMEQAFLLSHIQLKSLSLCDSRHKDQLTELISFADLIILCGGHVPTQNRFFAEINVKGALKDYQGVIMGISAGSMNSAALVYAQPELEGEALDPNYPRFIEGLALTNIRILPHLNELKGIKLDGMDIIGDIALSDSREHSFYGLVDGSYIICENDQSILYGEAYYFCDGNMKKICEKGQSIHLQPFKT